MNFLELLDGAEYLAQQGNPQIAGLDYDSRRVQPGWCFVAIRGETTDGNQYIDAALQAGAVAVVSDSLPPRPDVAWAQVPHGRRALARLSANFYGRPAERLSITGITGTNGKTTTSFMLNAMLRAAGRKAALVGTVEYRIGDEVLPAPHTTPEALELNQLFARAVEAGCTEAVMEVSSHALGAAAGLRSAVRRCRLHQPDARPSRLSRHHGRVLRVEDDPLHRARAPSRRESR